MNAHQIIARHTIKVVPTERVGSCGIAQLKATYDKVANAAYIYLNPGTEGTKVARMYPCDPTEVDGMINLNSDVAGRLVGVEVLAARTKLPPELFGSGRRPHRE